MSYKSLFKLNLSCFFVALYIIRWHEFELSNLGRSKSSANLVICRDSTTRFFGTDDPTIWVTELVFFLYFIVAMLSNYM